MAWHARRILLASLAVQKALELGWKENQRNFTARKYFSFDGPGKFEVRIFSQISYTVGNQTTTYVPTVITWLEELARSANVCESQPPSQS